MERTDPGTDVDEEHCRICGYGEDGLTWESGRPTAGICSRCGTESGIGDMGEPGTWEGLQGIRKYRGYWVGNGARRQSPSLRPKDWDLLTQLGGIPPEWR
ncbi:hypothetical protein GT204_13945 [Streptomyces sp. SID4919]|uniref:hypothetical protein n=1 Tax=unclassified Streptomyces TaxID=2593676 RepID=UPI000823875C|nr:MULTISPECIES: hypothetical protein [unclassified Streptomyces]MYY09984.1 hypothetical protein [Streptomyces sp. SID4919]SCK58815.1 hypothetical protein YW7DRAFT_05623 [Streptomyces sp. AmelKG-E11A]